MSLIRKSFQQLHYPTDIIAQSVRWYQDYLLSRRDLEEVMEAWGINVNHSTLHRWLLRQVPLIIQTARRYK